MRCFSPLLLLVFLATPALADRAPTAEETASITQVMEAEGCTGGSYEVDDENGVVENYEVDDARCADGVVMDYTLSPTFDILSKEIEN